MTEVSAPFPSYAHRMRAIMHFFEGMPRGTKVGASEIAERSGYPTRTANMAAGSLRRLVDYGLLKRTDEQPARWYRP